MQYIDYTSLHSLTVWLGIGLMSLPCRYSPKHFSEINSSMLVSGLYILSETVI